MRERSSGKRYQGRLISSISPQIKGIIICICLHCCVTVSVSMQEAAVFLAHGREYESGMPRCTLHIRLVKGLCPFSKGSDQRPFQSVSTLSSFMVDALFTGLKQLAQAVSICFLSSFSRPRGQRQSCRESFVEMQDVPVAFFSDPGPFRKIAPSSMLYALIIRRPLLLRASCGYHPLSIDKLLPPFAVCILSTVKPRPLMSCPAGHRVDISRAVLLSRPCLWPDKPLCKPLPAAHGHRASSQSAGQAI